MKKSVIAGLVVLLSPFVLASCGASSPAQPSPSPTPTPTPAPTPTPKPFSVIPPCALPESKPASADCGKPARQLADVVNIAIDRVMTRRPELFDFTDLEASNPRILDYDSYMTAVVAAIGQTGVCAKIDAEGEIGVKNDNRFNEQYIIASHAGYSPPIGNWVMRKYVGACSPATF